MPAQLSPLVPVARAVLPPSADWVSGLADEVPALAGERAPGRPIVCASGLSPSGPIHLGNLREVMVPHLVCDELKRRGIEVRGISQTQLYTSGAYRDQVLSAMAMRTEIDQILDRYRTKDRLAPKQGKTLHARR